MTDDVDQALLDARCTFCIDQGLECPEGYTAISWECDTCRKRFVLVKTGCNPHEDSCVDCGSKNLTQES